MQWQPIETAPTDGDTVIIHDKGFVAEGHYAWGSWWDNATECLRNPTHWMPLPEPPEE